MRTDQLWPDDRVQELTKLYDEGYSAREIARRMGGFEHTPDGGRCSVIGKIGRLGLNKTAASAVRRRIKVPSTHAEPRRKHRRRKLMISPGIQEPPMPLSDTDFPLNLRLSLMELTNDTCRWPLGELPFFFCGGKPATSLPYCAHHCRVAYQPATRR